jgi:hypothetical protein
LASNSWIYHPPPLPPTLFLVVNFPNLVIFLGGNGKIVQIQNNTKKKINYQDFEITNLKEKRLLLMNKILKIILIISTLNP